MNWNDKANINGLTPGTKITAHINIESREYNGRWFTDVKVWKFEIANAATPQSSSPSDLPPMDVPDANDPFGGGGEQNGDDLPF